MIKSEKQLAIFNKGEVGGLTYVLTNNIVNYIIVIATLSGVLGWPDELVYGRVIPGMSMGLLAGGLYYAFMAYKLSKKEGRNDVTALPSGVSTPAMFVILYGVIMPLHYSLNDPELAWSAAVAACFIGGLIEFFGGFIGPWLKKRIPRAALLGTVAGIGFFIPNPVNSIQALINGFAVVLPYLTIIIPIEIYNSIETMDNVEAANVAGDNYSIREAQFADGICTMTSAIFGGVVPNTVWLGHAGL